MVAANIQGLAFGSTSTSTADVRQILSSQGPFIEAMDAIWEE
jgi:hypothetical protein